MRTHKVNSLFLWPIAFICAAGIAVNAQVHTIERSFETAPGGNLDLNIPAGSVLIRGWDRNEVSIAAEVYGTPRTLDAMEMRLEQDGGDVTIYVRHRTRRVLRSHGRGDRERVNFTIHVPFEYHAQLRVSAGRIDIENIDGNIHVRNTAGATNISDIFGAIDVRTNTGSISVSLMDTPGRVSLSASTGSITLFAPETVNARFVLRSSVGRVSSSLRQFTGSGNALEFDYNQGGPRIEATTAIGSITVSPAAD
jgi:hypothetical protein